jgi:Protein of unknown function (DUF3592)
MERIISGIFALLIGFGGLLTGLKALKNRKILNQWKTTKGKVIERGIYQPDIPMLSPPAFRYSPLVRYTYQVDGKDFENNYILPKRIQAPQHSTQKWAQKKADSFPSEVTVHYNSADPSESYLIQTSKATLYLLLTLSVLVLLIGIGIFVIR